MIRRLCVGILALLCLTGLAPTNAAPARSPQAAAASHQQILVLLRLAPEHYRPNSDYGGGYGDNLARSAHRRAARRIARDHGLAMIDDWPMPLLGLDCFVMAVPDGQSIEAVALQVSRDPGVAWSEPMHVYHGQGDRPTHNDPLFQAQPAARQWRLADLHQLATGRGITVAVIDSRIENSHPDLVGQVVSSENFVPDQHLAPEQHGTAVAGIIAAKADNGLGIVGVAPRARLIGLRACWQANGGEPAAPSTVCDSLSLAKALHFAIEHHVQVINLSLSGPQDVLLGKLLEIGLAHGATVVAAYDQSLPAGGFPASFPGVIAVSDESLAAPLAGVYTAPGRDIPTTEPGGRWYLVNGSSYAAAHVSGLIALLRERRTSTGGPSSLISVKAGGGVIDACATLLRARPSDCACADAPDVTTKRPH
jgi:subtilisin family serine protease